MQEWQIVLASVSGFIGIVGAVFGITNFFYPTKSQMHKAIDEKVVLCQTKVSCDQFHKAQDERNGGFLHQIEEMKREIREDIREKNMEVRTDIRELIKLIKVG